MPEIDLEALIAKAEEVQDDRVVLTRNWTGKYRVYLYDYNEPDDDYNLTYEECIEQIRAWGALPKPKYLMVKLPFYYCELVVSEFDAKGKYEIVRKAMLYHAFTEALKPYQEQP